MQEDFLLKSIPSFLIGCTTLPAVSGILRTQAGRRGSGPGRWAGRDSALIMPPRRRAPTPSPPPPLAPRAAGRGAARSEPGGTGRARSPPPPPPLAPCAAGGGAHCALSLLAGVGCCPPANGRGCLLGCLSARRIAGTIAAVGPARGGRGAGSGPELPRVDRHQYR
jgi:hypothetical protein